ncbi:hypothetical protein HMPREF1624_05100 [Sporothrix schenckii ATCC 58251]|uniref:Zn(2)-C6 fungal-type domain-containing protein n=1 Tax=Sporothrix schenckii (strain ATCC 58251 / de Perez 2211183) TaxID=1391915 RepID=U7PTN2_SPOS1|nr:hypothetical protein HMPREF1624_05100 [Sporothrix schenckii ATCC 58251]
MPAKQRTSSVSTTPGEPPRPRGKPRGRRRDRDCVTCKTRGLKCDLNRPQCLPCVQAGLACGGYPMRVVWLEERQRPTSAAWSNKVTKPSRASTLTSPSTPTPKSTLPAAARASKLTIAAPAPAPMSAPPISSSPTFSLPTAQSSSPPPNNMLPMSPASSTMSAVSSLLIEKTWSETDQNSLIMRLAALCNHVLTTAAHALATGSTDENVNAGTHHHAHARHASHNDGQASKPHAEPAIAAATALSSTTIAASAASASASSSSYHTSSLARGTNHYLSLPETTGLLSDLCVFIQARLEGRSPAPRQQPLDSLEMVKYRLAALAHINRAIAAANPFAFLGIATFAVFEVCDDTAFGEWQRHLYGARHLLDYHHCRTLADLHRLAAMVPGLMDILARLVWFDVSGAVVHRAVGGPVEAVTNREADDGVLSPTAAAPPTPTRPGLIFDDWHRQVLLDDEFFATVGVPADACALYVDVAKGRLARRPVQACLRAAEQILRVAAGPGLSDWDLSANVSRCAAALAALSQAQAAHRETGHEDDDAMAEDVSTWESTTTAAVDKLCASLAATPASSRFYIHLAAGAYVGGMQVRTRAHCAVIKQYWLNCNVCGISRYPGGLALCEDHWRRIGLLCEEDDEP